MNPLVKKEIRLLMPGFLIGIALTFANCFFSSEGPNGFNGYAFFVSFIFCPAIVLFMALNSFGSEISAGTFSMLLAQPVSRRRIWRTKTLLLGAALFIGGFLWCAILYLFKPLNGLGDLTGLFAGVWLFLVVVYSGALWSVLLLRQVAAAFWFTLLVPGVIMVFIASLLGEKHSGLFFPAVLIALTIYSIAGFLLARRLFMRAQDAPWTGGTIALPEMRGASIFSAGTAERRFWRPQAALFWKEIQLHQAQFIMAGVLLLLHVMVIAIRKFGHYGKNSNMEFITEIFWGLWLVMPMLVGAAAVAEERKLGTLESQLGLPVKRRTQFAVKLRVVLLLSVLFGVVMPLLLEGSRILPPVHFIHEPGTAFAGWESSAQIFFWNYFNLLDSFLPLLTLLGMATAIGAISFYASTLARNTLQALAPAILGMVLTVFLVSVNENQDQFGFHLPWRGWLIYLIAVPGFAITQAAMSFWNFQRTNIGWNVFLRNTFTFAAALVFVSAATTAIYNRAWEKLTPFEPPHGAVRLSLSHLATMTDQWISLSVRLPDGRIWADDYTLNGGFPQNPMALFWGDIRPPSLVGGHFLDGSNWVSVTSGVWGERAGIKADGTLWVSEKPSRRKKLADGRWQFSKAGELVQHGSETNWSSIVKYGLSMLVVKNEGTLWLLGTNGSDFKRNEWPGLRSFTPQLLGTESNWAEVFMVDYQPYLRKTDDSLWEEWNSNMKQQIELAPGFSVGRMPFAPHGKWRSMTTDYNIGLHLGIRDDGTFRIWGDMQLNTSTRSYELGEADLQFGKETNWLGVAGRSDKIVTLKDDGTLWLWSFNHSFRRGFFPERDEREMLDVKPVRLGSHSDWIAVANADGGIISLAADGSLWYWPLEEAAYYLGELGDYDRAKYSNTEPLLDISRKPQFLDNIFSDTPIAVAGAK
jgi:ABC-type Na+ efflux pump permease subunit